MTVENSFQICLVLITKNKIMNEQFSLKYIMTHKLFITRAIII